MNNNNPNLKDQLEAMKGQSYAFDGRTETVLEYEFDGRDLKITTDVLQHEVVFENIKMYLKKFIVDTRVTRLPSKNGNVPMELAFNNTVFKELKGILMENIKKVQADKSYVPQAVQVKENIDSVIELAKTELQMVKMMHDLKAV